MIRPVAYCVLLLSFCSTASAQLDQLEKRIGIGSVNALSDSKVASGLKEALKVGTENAVKLTEKTDGYFKNEAIKNPDAQPIFGRLKKGCVPSALARR